MLSFESFISVEYSRICLINYQLLCQELSPLVPPSLVTASLLINTASAAAGPVIAAIASTKGALVADPTDRFAALKEAIYSANMPRLESLV